MSATHGPKRRPPSPRRPPSSGKPTSAPREKLERVYGVSAALSVFAHRPQDVVSIAHTPELRRVLADTLREAARRRIAYREVDAQALSELAQSLHHEGVCLLARPRRELRADALAELATQRGLILALDGVDNPHNVGAILRSAAYFAIAGLLLSTDEGTPVTAASRRVAEGGAEAVAIARVPDLPVALGALRERGFQVFGADARAEQRLQDVRWPARSVLVLGHERHGLSAAARKRCHALVRIDGSDAVESLNVSVAAGIFMASFAQTHGPAA